MSGHISTPGAAPEVGATKYASQMPSGVVMLTSRSVTATALATPGSVVSRPAEAAHVAKSRRVYFLWSSSCSC